MTPERILFIDRDGTLVEEPHDEQVDSLAKIRLLPGVIPALLDLKRAGYRFVLVSNQDGLGTDAFPEHAFREPQDFLRELFASQGIEFDAEFFCPHFPQDDCACRKPRTGLLTDYLAGRDLDLDDSYVIGDRQTDLDLAANLGIAGLRVRVNGADDESWPAIAARLIRPPRMARVARRTRETGIEVCVNLDRELPVSIATGIGFFDHMLEQIARHGLIDLDIDCEGDLHIDGHHTVEDVGITLGQAFARAVGDKKGIRRYGHAYVPLDEALSRVVVDFSGRPGLHMDVKFTAGSIGQLDTQLVFEFFQGFVNHAGVTLHIDNLKGVNAHHQCETIFKAFGRTLRAALERDPRSAGVIPSTKGSL